MHVAIDRTEHAPAGTPWSLSGIARRLVSDGLLTEAAAMQAQTDASSRRQTLVTHILARKLVPPPVLAQAIGAEFDLRVMNLDQVDLSDAPLDLVAEALMRRHTALPLFVRENSLFLAMADPTNTQALDEIKFHTHKKVECILVEHDKLVQALEHHLSDHGMPELDDADLEALDIGASEEEDDANVPPIDTEAAPIVRFVNKVLLEAIKKGASDIHFEPYEKKYRVRLRVDGELTDLATPPASMGVRLSARIKVLSNLDLAERRLPQDGRIKMNLSRSRAIDFRVSTCPTLHGEKIVLRILDPSSIQRGIDALGFEPAQKQLYLDAIHRPHGMVLVTGPTGSGKTVTLYAALNILNTNKRNISTVEDPAEINLPGVNQVNVHPNIGLTFAGVLRAFLRQDPDVIMVGEMRDMETAEIAIKAAQTGHMVLSTLHTNDAPQTLTRLINMGVPAYNIAASASLIIAQRLARKLCPHCKTPATVGGDELRRAGFSDQEIPGLTTIYTANEKGCNHCNEGHRGRIGLYQVMPVTEAIGELIMRGGSADDIDKQAGADGVLNLRRIGLNRVRDGILSLAEVNRVTVE